MVHNICNIYKKLVTINIVCNCIITCSEKIYVLVCIIVYMLNMKRHTVRRKVDPVLAPDQFSVARPLRPEDLDRHVTWHGIYPSLPAPNRVPWSEYVRSKRNRSRSVSSSTEALESDHARYITLRIAQHARSMATETRSLPTDSPVLHF